MGTQNSVISFTGGIQNSRGFKRANDLHCRTYISKKGGYNKHTFLTSPNLAVQRAITNEFQGDVDFSLQIHNLLKSFFLLKGFEFKQRIFKDIRHVTINGSGPWGHRMIYVSAACPFTLPYRIGSNSFDSIFNNNYSVVVNTGANKFDLYIPGVNDTNNIKRSPSSDFYNISVLLFCISDWMVSPPRGNKYFPLDDRIFSQFLYFHGTVSPITNLNSGSVSSFHYNTFSISSFENILMAIKFDTGKIINSIFYPDFSFQGSSIIKSLN